jgi:hypothetical protein
MFDTKSLSAEQSQIAKVPTERDEDNCAEHIVSEGGVIPTGAHAWRSFVGDDDPCRVFLDEPLFHILEFDFL